MNNVEKGILGEKIATEYLKSKGAYILENNYKIKSGEIVLGKNDKLVGTNDYIVTRFDPSSNKMVAVDSRNGKVIEDFPENRLPESKISRKDEETVTLFDGSEIKIYDSLEFDDGYVDDGD